MNHELEQEMLPNELELTGHSEKKQDITADIQAGHWQQLSQHNVTSVFKVKKNKKSSGQQ